MSTFDLSLAMTPETQSDVKASETYQKKIDSETMKPVEQKITESGITVDKSTAPKLAIGGPLGNYYTQLLNQNLTTESMGAIAQEGMVAVDATSEFSQANSGKVVVNEQGATIDTTGAAGYIFVTSAISLDKSRAYAVADKLLSMRASNPSRSIGLGLIGGHQHPVTESLVKAMGAADIPIAFYQTDVLKMACRMLKGE